MLDGLLIKYPNNNIARKNLARLEKLETAGAPRPSTSAHVAGSSPLFIEEGGKSCTTTLRLTGDASTPSDIVAGDTISLSISDDAVVAHSAAGKRLGAVEPRLARRLRKLMAGGNQYSAAVVSINEGALSIVIRETLQHPSLRNVVSFPPLRRGAGPDEQTTDPSSGEASESAEYSVIDLGLEPEQEDAIPALATDEIDDDADESNVGVPVLDTDDVDSDPILEIVPPQEEDWE